MIKTIIGYNSFFIGQCFDGNIPSGNIYRAEISNCKADAIKIDEGDSTTYNNQKQSWGVNTIALCDFKDLNLEAGNISLAGMPVEFLRIKKRKINELMWQTYKDLPFISGQTEYNWSDKFVESLCDYEYAIIPIGSQGIEGEYGIKSVECEYEDIWLLDGSSQYHLIANIDLGQIETVAPSVFIETLGSQYGYEINNGAIKYRKGSMKAFVLSDGTLYGNNGIDRKAEKTLRNNLYNFLTNKKPKIFKESENLYLLVSIPVNSVKVIPNNDLGRKLAEITFDYYEIGDSNSIQTLKDCGLLV